jgi:acid phosphatase type 7
MRAFISSFILIFFLSFGSYSQSIDNENFVITHGPYLQDLSSSGVTIIWTTNKPAVPGVSLTSTDGKSRFIRNSHDGLIDGGELLHKVRIDGLAPGNTYKYSINSVQILKYQAYKVYYGDTLAAKVLSFLTPTVKSEKTGFTVINDVHENPGKMASYLKNGNTEAQDFYIFNGDMVDYLQSSSQLFTGFIDTAVTYFARTTPFYYVRGNHETRGFAARDLKNYFDFKDDKFYYSFEAGPVYFIVLDCGEDKLDKGRYYYGLADFDAYRLEELDWLKKEVKSEAFRNAKKRIVIIHMPIVKEENQNHAMEFLSEKFGPVLKTAGINLMISAHIHRNAFYEAEKSGFGYPVIVNSNNSFLEVVADTKEIRLSVKDVDGKPIADYNIK